ncbi:MAG: carbamoyltransferase HypF, partial [Candidatus Nanopelagicales bacterium]
PITLPVASPPFAAVGGELKTTACVSSGHLAWLSQHIGDTENLETLAMLERTADTLTALQRANPRAIVSDAHPGYLSRGWAARRAAATGAAHLLVQHHHAHLASLLAEHGIAPDAQVLGVVFDGTGYGEDATVWGGELLLGSYAGVRRVGHLRPVLLPGGDAAVRHPSRSALAHLVAADLPTARSAPALAMGEASSALVLRMIATGSHCTSTSSVGRLFDAASSLLGIRHEADYEGQAAIELEAAAARARAGVPARIPDSAPGARREGDMVIIDPTSMLAAASSAAAAGADVPQAALAFHEALADAVAHAVGLVAQEHEFAAVGLTGGVFANAILSLGCLERLSSARLPVLTHGVVPPNDGGLALGQVAVAAAGGAREALPQRP